MAERTVMIIDPSEARIIEVGDLAYKIVDHDGNPDAPGGRWRLQEFPSSMLIRFDDQESLQKAMVDGCVMIRIGEYTTGRPPS